MRRKVNQKKNINGKMNGCESSMKIGWNDNESMESDTRLMQRILKIE